jgi:hypothetical protein
MYHIAASKVELQLRGAGRLIRALTCRAIHGFCPIGAVANRRAYVLATHTRYPDGAGLWAGRARHTVELQRATAAATENPKAPAGGWGALRSAQCNPLAGIRLVQDQAASFESSG